MEGTSKAASYRAGQEALGANSADAPLPPVASESGPEWFVGHTAGPAVHGGQYCADCGRRLLDRGEEASCWQEGERVLFDGRRWVILGVEVPEGAARSCLPISYEDMLFRAAVRHGGVTAGGDYLMLARWAVAAEAATMNARQRINGGGPTRPALEADADLRTALDYLLRVRNGAARLAGEHDALVSERDTWKEALRKLEAELDEKAGRVADLELLLALAEARAGLDGTAAPGSPGMPGDPEALAAFQPGTVVRHVGTGEGYVVMLNQGRSAVAVQVATISNPREWTIVSEAPSRTVDRVASALETAAAMDRVYPGHAAGVARSVVGDLRAAAGNLDPGILCCESAGIRSRLLFAAGGFVFGALLGFGVNGAALIGRSLGALEVIR